MTGQKRKVSGWTILLVIGVLAGVGLYLSSIAPFKWYFMHPEQAAIEQQAIRELEAEVKDTTGSLAGVRAESPRNTITFYEDGRAENLLRIGTFQQGSWTTEGDVLTVDWGDFKETYRWKFGTDDFSKEEVLDLTNEDGGNTSRFVVHRK